VQHHALALTAGVLQQRDGGSLVLLGEDLAGDELLSHALGHFTGLGVDTQVGCVVELNHPIGVRINVDGDHLVVVQRLDTQIRQRVDAEVLLGGVLDVAQIGVDGGLAEVLHVVLYAGHIALVVHTEVEHSARGRVEEGAHALEHVHVLGVLIGLHIVVRREDD